MSDTGSNPPPSVTGDPHVTRLDGTRFDFHGTPNATYNLLTVGDLAIHGSLSGSGKVIHRAIIRVGPGGSVEFDERDLRRVVAGGWMIDVHRLNLLDDFGEPHLNVHPIEAPEDRRGATGLLVDGTPGADPLAYQVAPPPGRERPANTASSPTLDACWQIARSSIGGTPGSCYCSEMQARISAASIHGRRVAALQG